MDLDPKESTNEENGEMEVENNPLFYLAGARALNVSIFYLIITVLFLSPFSKLIFSDML